MADRCRSPRAATPRRCRAARRRRRARPSRSMAARFAMHAAAASAPSRDRLPRSATSTGARGCAAHSGADCVRRARRRPRGNWEATSRACRGRRRTTRRKAPQSRVRPAARCRRRAAAAVASRRHSSRTMRPPGPRRGPRRSAARASDRPRATLRSAHAAQALRMPPRRAPRAIPLRPRHAGTGRDWECRHWEWQYRRATPSRSL